jgi:hypothetical protein
VLRSAVAQAVALLTADNLVFLARLRAAEAGAAAAVAERDELKLALEQHKGPWMDEVRRFWSWVFGFVGLYFSDFPSVRVHMPAYLFEGIVLPLDTAYTDFERSP